MISESTVRRWYVPVEVETLRRWLLVSFIVNLVLLSIDMLRGGGMVLRIGFLGLVAIGLLIMLPEASSIETLPSSWGVVCS